MPTIDQGGNAFSTTMVVGTTDAFNMNLVRNSIPVAVVTSAGIGMPLDKSIVNLSSTANATITPTVAGTVIKRDINDGEFSLTINYVQGTGGILRGQFNGVDKFKVLANGQVRINPNPSLPDPNNFLDVDSGTNPGNTAIAKFSQNSGSITLGNGTSTASVFSPTISGVGSGGVPWGMLIQGRQGTSSNFTGVILRGVNASGGALGINSNTLQVQNFGSTQLTINYQGVVTINNLAGTGTRMVTADSTGTLSATTVVESGTYTPTITGIDIYTPRGFRFSRI